MQLVMMVGIALTQSTLTAPNTTDRAVTIAGLIERLQAAEARIDTADEHIADLTAGQGVDWLTEQRSESIRGIVQDVLADADTRSNLQGNGATSGYNDGFFIRSSDGQWSMRFNGVFQQRWNVGHQSGSAGGVTRTYPGIGTVVLPANTSNPVSGDYNTAFGFETTRMVSQISGTMPGNTFFDARLEYSPYGGGGFTTDISSPANWVINGAGTPANPYTLDYLGSHHGGGVTDGPLEWAYAGWHINDDWSVRIGRQKFQVTRSFIVNAEDQQAIERSASSYYWATSTITNGIKFVGDLDNTRANVMIGNGSASSGSNDSWLSNGHGWGVSGRMEFLLSGEWKQFDRIGTSPGAEEGVLLGIGSGYLQNGDQSQSNWLVSSDLSYQSDRGWNLYGSITAGDNNNGLGSELNNMVNTSLGITTFNGFQDNDGTSVGFEIGAGAYITEKTELYTRWQWLSPGIAAGDNPLSLAGNPSSKLNMLTLGVNHYLVNPQVKLSLDWTWSFTDPSTAFAYGNGAWGYTGWWASSNGSTTGSLWLLRTQMQLSF